MYHWLRGMDVSVYSRIFKPSTIWQVVSHQNYGESVFNIGADYFFQYRL